MSGEATRHGQPGLADERGLGLVAVVGAGAIGLVYAGLLAAIAPNRVMLVTRRKEARESLGQELIVVRPDGARVRVAGLDVRSPEECLAAPPSRHDIAIVAVSAYDTSAVAGLVEHLLGPSGLAITVQNGLDNRAALARVLGQSRAVQGSTSFAAHRTDPTEVRMDSLGATWLPIMPDRVAWFEGWLAAAGLNPLKIDDPEELAWRKTAIGTNGYISLILASPAATAMRCPSSRELARRASSEIVAVANAAGIGISRPEILNALQAAWANFSDNARSSFYSDYLAGKKTELDERLGALLVRASNLKVPVPTLETLYLLSKARLELQDQVK